MAKLGLPAGDYAIFGSGPLLVRGVIEHVVTYKRIANRDKDREHLAALRAQGLWPVPDPVAE